MNAVHMGANMHRSERESCLIPLLGVLANNKLSISSSKMAFHSVFTVGMFSNHVLEPIVPRKFT